MPGVLLRVDYQHSDSGKQTMAKYNPQDYQDGFYRAKPGFSPQTGEGENWDGTSHGAIEDMLMDTDGDGDWDDFEGDGMPDDKV